MRSGGLGGKSSAGLSNGDNGAAPAPSRLSRHAAASVALPSLSLIARDLVARLTVVALPQPLAALARHLLGAGGCLCLGAVKLGAGGAVRVDAVGGRRALVVGARHALRHVVKVFDRLARREYVNGLAVTGQSDIGGGAAPLRRMAQHRPRPASGLGLGRWFRHSRA